MTMILLVNALMTAAFVGLFALSAWITRRLLGPAPGPERYHSIDDHQLADSA